MPKLDIENPYSRRSYYFGVIALISFLVINLLQGVKRLTETKVPTSLFVTISLVCVFSGIASIYTIIKAKSEANTFKKIIATILAMASFVYIVFLVRVLFFTSLYY